MYGNLQVKIKRRLFEGLKTTVPYRTKYRPNGIYEGPAEAAASLSAAGAYYHDVYSDYTTELPVPKSLFDRISPYTLYDEYTPMSNDMVSIRYTSDYGVLSIPNGRIYSNNKDNISVVTPDNKLVARVSYQYHEKRITRFEENRLLSQKYFIKPTYIDGTVFSMLAGFGATHNIGHWFFDAIPRLHLLKKSGLFDQVDYFLVPAYKYDYHIDSLKALGIGPERIIEGKQDTHLIAKNLIVSHHPRGDRSYLLPKWITEFLRESYLNLDTGNKAYPKYVYVSRKDSKLRRVVNEDQVMNLLSGYGFESVVMSDYRFAEKVKLFHGADFIICSNGAGLTSLFFGKPGAKVIEIFSQGFVHTHYYNIAYHAGMEHYSLVCKSDNPATDMKAGQLEDLRVNLDELDALIKQILKPA